MNNCSSFPNLSDDIAQQYYRVITKLGMRRSDLQPENEERDATGFAKKTNACLPLLLMPIKKSSIELTTDLFYILMIH